jgi:hypothetical protein
MSTWRVEQHYGFGAARIPIQPEPHRTVRVGFSEGLGALVRELTEGGVVATMRRAAGEASAILLSLLILAAVVVTLMRDHSDVSSIDVVLLETVVRDPEPLIEEVEEVIPAPVPLEIAKPEPLKRVEPKPTPPPQQIAQKPKPPPVAKPKPRSRPKPVIPQIARIEAPKPPPVQKLDRSVRERPQQIARPRVAIEAARPKLEQAAPTPRMDRMARRPVERTSPTRRTPQMSTPAAPALDRPREDSSKRAFRVASAKPTPGKRPRALPGMAPVPSQSETVRTPSDARAARSSGQRPTAPRPTRRPAPKLSSAPVPMPTSAPTATPERSARLAPETPTRRAPRPTAQVARATNVIDRTMPTPVSRSGRASPQAPRGSKADLTGVAGVPLGDLAACLSDREEDRLKQAVVAAVTTQEECRSSKGTYRFIETKNLNAFLMWIDRAPARPVSDRCVELGYALECLQSAGRRAAR